MVLQGGDTTNPLDSTPDPTGTAFYFTATNAQGSGVFRVAAAGGIPGAVAVGSPFVAARDLAISPDGAQLYIADPQAGNGGEIFVLPPSGGTPTPLRGSQGSAPQNLTVVNEGGQAVVYFTGTDPASKQPAVLKLAIAGADAPQVVAKDAPLSAPDGITVTSAGTVYVADRTATTSTTGKVFKVQNGTVSVLVDQVRTGNPPGIALAGSDTLLLVSALQAAKNNDQVLVVDLTNGHTGSITKGVGANSQAGGLHAAARVNVFSWADVRGGVYSVKPG